MLNNEFDDVVKTVNVDDKVSGTIRYVGESLVFVELDVNGHRCPGFLHKSQVSNLMFVSQPELRSIFATGTEWTFVVKRFDETRRVVEVERRFWLKSQHKLLEYGKVFAVTAIANASSRKRRTFVYGDNLEARAPDGVDSSGAPVDVHIVRRGATVRDIEVGV